MSEKWTAAARRERNEYMTRWRRKNRDRVKEYQRQHWERKAAAKKQSEAVIGRAE